MRVLAACSLGGAGHLNPLLPFLAAATRRGDDVLVVGPPALRGLVESAGVPFRPGGEPPEETVASIRERLPLVSREEASALANRELFGRLATAAMLRPLEQACAEWHPDLLLREPCEYASAIVAPRLGIPLAQVAISLAEAEAGSIRTAAPALEEHRQGLVAELLESPYLTRFPASLDPSPFPTTIRFRETAGRTHAPLPDWWAGSDAPLVYATFGTVLGHMSIASRVYRAALRAVADLDARVLLTVGRRFDLSELGPAPANVHVERWVDQAHVLAEADLVACHGGSGTALGALAAGLPLVLVPLFADQFENSRRIAAAGAGTVVGQGHFGEEDAPLLREQIERVLAESSFAQRARSIADEIAAAPSVDRTLDELSPATRA